MTETPDQSDRRRQIVVLGAGFAGLTFCKRFRGPAHVTLVDRQNHHLFQPLLYQVATAGLSAPDIAQPIRSILAKRPNITVRMDEATGIDPHGRTVTLRGGTLRYDYLVFALGGRTTYFGHDEWAKHAIGLKSIDNAMAVRRRVLTSFERAETTDDAEQRRRLMTIVVVGGGPTGVELAGAFAELTRRVFRRDFRRIDTAEARVILVEAAPRVLGTYPSELSESAKRQLERLGVQVWTSAPVTDIRPGCVQIEDEVIESQNIFWTAGVGASPLTKQLGVETLKDGRVPVEADLSVPGHPEVFVLGDAAAVQSPDGTPVPGIAPAAIQMGKHVAGLIAEELEQGPREPAQRPAFAFVDRGQMATIGRKAAVAWVHGWRFSGLLAWLAWLGVHLLFLIGFRNKLAVLLNWVYNYVVYRRGARIIFGRQAADAAGPEPPGRRAESPPVTADA